MPTSLIEGHGRSTGLVDDHHLSPGEQGVSAEERRVAQAGVRARAATLVAEAPPLGALIMVTSIETYLKYSEAVGQLSPVSKLAIEGKRYEEVIAENAALRAQINTSTLARPRDRRRAAPARR